MYPLLFDIDGEEYFPLTSYCISDCLCYSYYTSSIDYYQLLIKENIEKYFDINTVYLIDIIEIIPNSMNKLLITSSIEKNIKIQKSKDTFYSFDFPIMEYILPSLIYITDIDKLDKYKSLGEYIRNHKYQFIGLKFKDNKQRAKFKLQL